MKALSQIFVWMLAAALAGIIAASAQAQTPESGNWQPNELLVKLMPGIEETGQDKVITDLLDARKMEKIYGTDVWVMEIPDVVILEGRNLDNPEKIAEYLRNAPHPYIEYAEPNYLYSIGATTPNDPMYANLWGMNTIQAPEAWDTDHDCNDVVVGVIDTGVDWKHPDLVNNIWQNLGEDADGDGHVLEFIGGTWQFDPGDVNGIDNDGNGFADDFVGWDFVNNDNNPMDDNSHGTHCAGTIGARGNNSLGVAGVCWEVKIMALKFLGASGGGTTIAAVAALNYANSKGVKITSNSWGSGWYSTPLYNAIQNAQNNDALFVAAAGNTATNNDLYPHYPSSYTLPNIIAVASSMQGDVLSSFSCYGASSVDLAAPGSGIYSTTPNNSYGYKNGTSMATPHVAGAAALVWCPGMTYTTLKNTLLNQVDVLPAFAGKCVSGGRLNVFKALNNATCCTAAASFTSPAAPYCTNQVLAFVNTSVNATAYQWKVDNILQSTGTNFNYIFTTPGLHTVTLIASTGSCSDAYTQIIAANNAPAAGFTSTTTNLTLIVAGTAGAAAYLWNFGDGTTASGVNATHTYANPGIYTVCLTTTGSCGNTNTCQNIAITAACEDAWTQYTNGDNINAIAEEGNYIWAGTMGGLVRIDKTSGSSVFYNSANSGLPDNWALAIVIDAAGNKWIGTRNGLARFDGTNWTIYNTSNSGLPYNYVNAITIDATGNKWIGTNDGLAKFDGTNWTIYNTSNSGLPYNYVNAITLDAVGNKWIGTGNGLAKFDGTNWTTYNSSNSGLPNNWVLAIAIDAAGNKWIGTGGGGGLAKFDGTNWTIYNTSNSGLPHNYVSAITIDATGNKWIGTNDGLAKFDGINWAIYNTSNSGLPNNDVNAIAIDATGNKWIGTNDGLAKFDGINWAIYNTSNSGLPNNDVNAIAIDGAGNKWIATNELGTGTGLTKFNNNSWTTYTTSNSGLPSNYINAITIDAANNIWIGTNNGLSKFDGTNWTTYNTSNSGLPSNYIQAIAIDATNNKLIGTENGGLAKFSGNSWTIYNSSNSGLISNSITTIAIDDANDVWVGCGGSGSLINFDGINWNYYTPDFSFPNDAVIEIAIDFQGNKWISTSTLGGAWGGDGITKFDNVNWTTYSTWNSWLPGDYVGAIAIDAAGNKWIGTDNGLAKFDDTNWTIYNSANSGLPFNGVSVITIDADGNKWIGTGVGIGVLGNCQLPCQANPSFTTPGPTCINSPTIFTNTSTGASSYQWFVNNVAAGTSSNLTYTFTDAGSYFVKLVASNGSCSNQYAQTITIQDNCVWPGDANADGTVSMLDWLALGLAYNKTGPPRADQTINFDAKPAANFATAFNGSLFTGINHKHADCNGNGIVNAADTTAIVQNFGLSHALDPADIPLSDNPEALLSMQTNTPAVATGASAFIDITIANAINGGALSCYGMAFTLHYRGANPRLHFNGSCLGTIGTDFIATYRADEANELLHVGITRINQTNAIAQGKIATLEVSIDETPASGAPLSLNMSITGAAVDESEGYFIPAGAGASATLDVYNYLALEQPPLLNAKVLLQGALSGDVFLEETEMQTTLRNNNLLPAQQPYNSYPWLYNGTENVGSPANLPANAVDWVLLELRTAAEPNSLVWRKAALLLSDGSIQDAVNPIPGRVRLETTLPGGGQSLVPANADYYLIVRHRNHLAVVSSVPLPISGNMMTCNFTQTPTNTMGGIGQLAPAGSRYALKGGDLNANGIFNVTDYNAYASNPSAVNQYLPNDCNLDGMISVADFNLFSPNLSAIGVFMVRYYDGDL